MVFDRGVRFEIVCVQIGFGFIPKPSRLHEAAVARRNHFTTDLTKCSKANVFFLAASIVHLAARVATPSVAAAAMALSAGVVVSFRIAITTDADGTL